MLVQNENVRVVVSLSNPLAVDLHVQNLKLRHGRRHGRCGQADVDAGSTSGVPFETDSAGFLLPAKTAAKDVQIVGRALAPGLLVLRGVKLTLFNIEREHLLVATMQESAAPRGCGPAPRRAAPRGAT